MTNILSYKKSAVQVKLDVFSGELPKMEPPDRLEQRPSEAFPERPVHHHRDGLRPERAVRLEREPRRHRARAFRRQRVRPVWQLQQPSGRRPHHSQRLGGRQRGSAGKELEGSRRRGRCRLPRWMWGPVSKLPSPWSATIREANLLQRPTKQFWSTSGLSTRHWHRDLYKQLHAGPLHGRRCEHVPLQHCSRLRWNVSEVRGQRHKLEDIDWMPWVI